MQPTRWNPQNSTHTHTHTRIKRCLAFLFSVFLFISPVFSTTLPSGYTELEYIETTGTQWVDTGIYGNLDTSFEIMCQTTVEPTEDMRFVPFGSRESATESNIMVLFDVDNVVIADFGDYTKTRLNAHVNDVMNKFKIYNSCNSRYIQDITDNITYNSTKSYDTNFTTPTTLRVAAVGPGFHALQKNFIGKIWYVKIWTGNMLVRDFVPVRRNSDGVLGMYDTVTNAFFTNAGTGTFIAGPAVAQPATVEIIWGGLAEPEASGMCVYGETFTAPSTAPTAPSGLKFLGWRPR